MPLYNYAIQSWHIDEDNAWDIIYKVLFRITEKVNNYTFKNEAQFRNMLYTIFNNELINFYRKTKKIEERLKFIRLDDTAPEKDISAEPSLEKEINETMLKKAVEDFWENPEAENILLNNLNNLLDDLEDWERILIHQRGLGMAYENIAKFVDKPENQLKVYYSRIKIKIQNELLKRMRETGNEQQ